MSDINIENENKEKVQSDVNKESIQTNVKKDKNNMQKVYIKEKRAHGVNIFLVLIIAIIGGILGSVATFIILKHGINTETDKKGEVAINNTKYEIQSVENPVVAIAKETGPAIVGIEVEGVKENMFGMSTSSSSSEGSGIIYSENGYIVTNYHVIEDAIENSKSKIYVTLPNDENAIEATVIGGDKVTDLAVIKIEKTGLTFAKFGDSSKLNVGELAVAIGNPLGQEFAGSVTVGYISALNRKVSTDGRTYKLIQTDAAINPGNSGGALVNQSGEVIGINTVKIASSIGTSVEGLGFAIPSNDAKPIIEELIKNKKIVRPYIGITGIDVDSSKAKANDLPEGIYVYSVIQNSPASKAGLQKGDIIISVDGLDNSTSLNMEKLNEFKNSKSIGDKITLKVNRQDEIIEIKVTLEGDDI